MAGRGLFVDLVAHRLKSSQDHAGCAPTPDAQRGRAPPAPTRSTSTSSSAMFSNGGRATAGSKFHGRARQRAASSGANDDAQPFSPCSGAARSPARGQRLPPALPEMTRPTRPRHRARSALSPRSRLRRARLGCSRALQRGWGALPPGREKSPVTTTLRSSPSTTSNSTAISLPPGVLNSPR